VAGEEQQELSVSVFITFEGPDGSGKTTHLKLLAEWLRDQGYDVLETREPGGTAIGEKVRAIVLDRASQEMEATTEILLFSAARAQHVGQIIRPHLSRGGIVLCDRYADSTLAYQGYGRGLDLPTLRVINSFATSGLRPALIIYLDVPVEEGLERRQQAKGGEWNRLDAETLAFHQRVRAGYLALAAEEPHRWAIIDATRPTEVVQQEIRERVKKVLTTAS
jgi:dTMP kinase